jgi:hypothetical protein
MVSGYMYPDLNEDAVFLNTFRDSPTYNGHFPPS